MAFTIFVHSTTANAEEVNNNFLHISQGARLPRTGNSLTAQDLAYDIGSTDYKWDEIFIATSYAGTYNSGSTTYELLTSVQITTTSSSIEITGLNGDVYPHMVIDFYQLNPTASSSRIIFNGDSSASYANASFFIDNKTKNYNTSLTSAPINPLTIIAPRASIHEISLYLKSSEYKLIKIESANNNLTTGITTTTIQGNFISACNYMNNTTTITSLKIYGTENNSFSPGTKLNMWVK